MFCSYSEFLEPVSQVKGFIPSRNQLGFHQHLSYLSPPVLTQNDHVYSQFTDVISRRLLVQAYPGSYQNFNPFCPLCLKFVENGTAFTTCFLSNDRNYLIHQQCLKKDRGYQMRSVGELVENKISYEQICGEAKNKFYCGIGSRYFYIEVSFCHPISDKCFLKINKRVLLIKNSFTIQFNQEEPDSYFPNIVLLPLTDFTINVSIHEMNKKDNRSKLVKYISLRNCKERRRLMMTSEEVAMEIEIVQDILEKQTLSQNMNYKYKYPLDLNIPILRIRQFKIDLPEQFEESDQEEYFIGSKSTIVEELLNQTQQHSVSTIRTSEQPQYQLSLSDSSSSQGQTQKINLTKLITTNSLIQFVKINTQSRLFQIFLDECCPDDISMIIGHIQPAMPQLIKHEYGNYMIQKLFTVCNPLQRYSIIQIITPQLAELIKNKQGTHTIQSFIDHFTLNEQFQLVSMYLREQYYDLCKNNNSTHFIQKVVKTFPLQITLPFFQYTIQNLLAFALDKNAMCVIKHMMRRLRELEGKIQLHDQAIEVIKRQLIFNVTFSVDRLIMDSFGNYVIQFCYQMFDLERCSGITERILYQFPTYAIGKFSSNVLLKCISTYWTDKRIYSSLKSISSNQIVELFRNKDGNKILLEMMERLEGIELWDRFYGIMIRIEPTRFYHDRWGVCLGSRSGQVGTRLLGFPEAKKKQYVRK